MKRLIRKKAGLCTQVKWLLIKNYQLILRKRKKFY